MYLHRPKSMILSVYFISQGQVSWAHESFASRIYIMSWTRGFLHHFCKHALILQQMNELNEFLQFRVLINDKNWTVSGIKFSIYKYGINRKSKTNWTISWFPTCWELICTKKKQFSLQLIMAFQWTSFICSKQFELFPCDLWLSFLSTIQTLWTLQSRHERTF